MCGIEGGRSTLTSEILVNLSGIGNLVHTGTTHIIALDLLNGDLVIGAVGGVGAGHGVLAQHGGVGGVHIDVVAHGQAGVVHPNQLAIGVQHDAGVLTGGESGQAVLAASGSIIGADLGVAVAGAVNGDGVLGGGLNLALDQGGLGDGLYLIVGVGIQDIVILAVSGQGVKVLQIQGVLLGGAGQDIHVQSLLGLVVVASGLHHIGVDHADLNGPVQRQRRHHHQGRRL